MAYQLKLRSGTYCSSDSGRFYSKTVKFKCSRSHFSQGWRIWIHKICQQQSLSGVCKNTFPDYVDHIKATFLGRVQFLAIYCSIAIILTSARTFGRDFSEIWVNVRLRISTDVRLGLRICTELLHNLLHKMFKCFS